MEFEAALNDARRRFTNNAQFVLRPNESIKTAVKRNCVPDAYGVYIYFNGDNTDHPLYVGKAGSMNADGSWTAQGLAGRLTMKQGGIYREPRAINSISLRMGPFFLSS
jgi:hypothetical protein